MLWRAFDKVIGESVNNSNRGEIAIQVALDKESDTRVDLNFSVYDMGIGIPKDLSHMLDKYLLRKA